LKIHLATLTSRFPPSKNYQGEMKSLTDRCKSSDKT